MLSIRKLFKPKEPKEVNYKTESIKLFFVILYRILWGISKIIGHIFRINKELKMTKTEYRTYKAEQVKKANLG